MDDEDLRTTRLEDRIADLEARLSAVETLLESGGTNLADLRREPPRARQVLAALRDLQVRRLEDDVPQLLRRLGPDPSRDDTDRLARSLAEDWEVDLPRYRSLLAVTRRELRDRAGLSDKTLKACTDHLHHRGLLLRWGGPGGGPRDREVRFAVPPRTLIRPLRALLAPRDP